MKKIISVIMSVVMGITLTATNVKAYDTNAATVTSSTSDMIPKAVYNAAGFSGITTEIDTNKDFNVKAYFNSENISNISSVKLSTKYKVKDIAPNKDYYNYGSYINKDDIIKDSDSYELKKDDSSNYFTTTIKKDSLKEFGYYYVDKIEISYQDGSKKVIYNNSFYSSLSENDKENGVLQYLNMLFNNESGISISNPLYSSKVARLDKEFTYSFTLSNGNVSPSSVYVYFNNISDTTYNKIIKAEKVEGSENQYIAKVTFTNSLETGNWYISNIKVTDSLERTDNIIQSRYNSENFKVASINADVEAPVLNSIKLTDKVYDYNSSNKAKFILDISDDISGFESGYISICNADNGNNIRNVLQIMKDDESGSYYVTINEWNSIPNGNYKISDISLDDNAKNSVNYKGEDYPDLAFEVINASKIEILSCENTNKNMSVDGSLGINIKVKSNKEINYANIWLRNGNRDVNEGINLAISKGEKVTATQTPSTATPTPSTATTTSEDNKYEYIYTLTSNDNQKLSKYSANGDYQVYSLEINFKSNSYGRINLYDNRPKDVNKGELKFDFSALDFNLTNPKEDITAPKVTKIDVTNKIILPGQSTDIVVYGEDENSGFNDDILVWGRKCDCYLWYSIGDQCYSTQLGYDKELKAFKGKLEIGNYASTGTYKILQLQIDDIAGNMNFYRNDDNYQNDNKENKELLDQGTILVKKSLDEAMPPVVTSSIKDGAIFTNSVQPVITTDQGTISMLLNDKAYDGSTIDKIGNYNLFITATGIDKSVTTKMISFKVRSEITDSTQVKDIVKQISESTEKKIEIKVGSKEKTVDKDVLKAIKGTDKEVSFVQDDKSVWTFNGKNITTDTIPDINISITSEANDESAKEKINDVAKDARVIHFDYHGELPGKASVKIYVGTDSKLFGKNLTLYFYNAETKKPEKVQGPLAIDKEGFVTIEITHCSDYFLSENSNLSTAEQELEAAKTTAKASLDTYKDANVYREAQKAELKLAISNGKTAIDTATTIETVQAAGTNAKTAIDAIKTDAQLKTEEELAAAKVTAEKLLEAKTTAKTSLDTYKDVTAYREAQKTELTAAINTGKTNIDNAIVAADVTKALETAKTAIDAIKTDAELTAEEKKNSEITNSGDVNALPVVVAAMIGMVGIVSFRKKKIA